MTGASVLATTQSVQRGYRVQELLPSGVAALDKVIQGFPRGAISEIAGPESSGRATLAQALMAASTSKLEICAYVDADNSFDPHSAAASGVILSQLVWIRCNHDIEHAFKSADLLLHAGGFGVIVLDLSRAPDRVLQRAPISYWHRFRRAIENTPTILLLLEREAQAKSCAGMILELTRKKAVWCGAAGFHLLREVEIEAGCRKPFRPVPASFCAEALA